MAKVKFSTHSSQLKFEEVIEIPDEIVVGKSDIQKYSIYQEYLKEWLIRNVRGSFREVK
ncbi:hypothetical protein LC087_02260 [Bacillus carboniphilus]|uniref:Uncharacterized protein n=1 Tax=Bacillus carboniphilus TaxID=86663 RepID=A0ABY9JUJ4_9BACI|nr:hypothetical protein [Bacillus carboniphilus]WLR43060.1 hypothetical protein LC087_02260 [Bacillus carboniphilus]